MKAKSFVARLVFCTIWRFIRVFPNNDPIMVIGNDGNISLGCKDATWPIVFRTDKAFGMSIWSNYDTSPDPPGGSDALIVHSISSRAVQGISKYNTGVSGTSEDYYGVYGSSFNDDAGHFDGDVTVTGHLSKGSGSFIQPHPDDPAKEINYVMFEGRDHRVFFDGVARTEGGEAVLEIPEDFKLVASRDKPLNVILTPFGDEALYVKERSLEKIIVTSSGNKDIEFGYLVIAARGGFEESYPIQENTHFRPGKATTIKQFEERYSLDKDKKNPYAQAGKLLERKLLQSSGVLDKEGKININLINSLGWEYSLESDTLRAD